MATSINDIARVAGVSCTTVLRALWDKDRIAPATKARVLKVATEMNYRPNMVARSLVSGKTKLIGLLIGPSDARTSNYYINPLYSMIREAGYGVLIHMAVEGPESEQVCVDDMVCNRVSGVLAQPTVLSGDPAPYQQLLAAGIPVVVLDRAFDGFEAPQVVADQYLMGYLPTEYLISLGHRRIAHLAMPGEHYLRRERIRGFKDAMMEAGIEVDESNIIDAGWFPEDGANVMRELLKRGTDMPTAIVARHDWVAVGTMSAALDAGLSIPGDISIIGVGDMPLTDMLSVPLTTVYQPSVEIAVAAIGYLMDILQGKAVEPGIHVVKDVRLIVRKSCGSPRSRY
ncbi:MAG: LacI family transcriptional regulator [Armatimonadetes bacterium]|nr:LacI family transcriptional regulator [Armatimonadota bacterium]